MQENQGSLTALLTAYARAYHATHDTLKIFDDFLANELFTDQERAYFGQNLAEALKFLDPEQAAACPDQASALAGYMRIQGGPVTLSRSRYTEDCLEAAIQQGVRQYVILGAGLDTLAFRRPDLLKQIDVYEIDHPATQAMKRQRLADRGWEIPARLHLVPVDFAQQDLASELAHSAYDPHTLSFVSWLGVTYYLARGVVFDTLRTLSGLAPAGSTLVFDYFDADAFTPGKASFHMQRVYEIVRRAGEPMQTGFDPSSLAADLARLGFRLQENLGPDEIQERYFRGRTDGYRAFEHAYFTRAFVN